MAAGLCATTALARAGRFVASCHSGMTVFEDGGVRAFEVSFTDEQGDPWERLLACLPRSRAPITLFDAGPYNYVRARNFHLIGSRVGFVVRDEGYANGSETDLGWFDERSGAVRRGAVNLGVNGGRHDPELPDDSLGYTIAQNGTMAFVAGAIAGCQVVGVLLVRRRAYEFGYRLGPPVALYTAPSGGLRNHSITITATTVTWRSQAGAIGTAQLPPAGTPGTPGTGGC
jgi:hypothetical protein